jgi:hypothetical protein
MTEFHADQAPVATHEQAPSTALSTPDVEALVERTPDGREACTLLPADASGEEFVTTWLTAESDAFVQAADCR